MGRRRHPFCHVTTIVNTGPLDGASLTPASTDVRWGQTLDSMVWGGIGWGRLHQPKGPEGTQGPILNMAAKNVGVQAGHHLKGFLERKEEGKREEKREEERAVP